MPYEVATAVFEGPFDLLLHLITREQVDIYEVSLSKIVDAYVAELERLEGLDLDAATEFLLIAAILLELKSRRLLPGVDGVEMDEEFALWEERDLLLARLLESKTFKDAAAAFDALMARAARSVPRTSGLEEPFLAVVPDLLAGVTPAQLRMAFLRATAPRPAPRVDLDHVAPIRASVQDAVEDLARELPGRGPTTFHALTQGITERLTIIVHFLAVLELFKQGMVEIEQAGNFATIEIRWTGGDHDDATPITVEEYQG
mgnify:CR=1 FL=1